MHQNRLIKVLRTFSPKERKRFRQFVVSPYFTGTKSALLLDRALRICFSALKSGKDAALERQRLSAAIFGGQAAPAAGKLDKLFSQLHLLAQDFLVFEHWQSGEQEAARLIESAEIYLNRGLQAHFHHNRKAARARSRRQLHLGSAYYFQRFRLEEMETNFALMQPTRSIPFRFNEMYEALFLLYQSVKQNLENMLYPVLHRYAYRLSELALWMQREALPPEHFLARHSLLRFNQAYLQQLSAGVFEASGFDDFVRQVQAMERELSLPEVKNCWTMVRNLLIHWSNQHHDESLDLQRRYVDLFLEHLHQGYLYTGREIMADALYSFCGMALAARRADEFLAVLNQHRGRISGEPAHEPCFNYCLASYYLHTGAPEKTLDLLPLDTPDSSNMLQVKIIELQALYATGSELLPYRIDAFRMFLKRTGRRQSAHLLDRARLFLNFLAQIHRCRQGDRRRAETVLKRIRQHPHTTGYFWLLEQAEARGSG